MLMKDRQKITVQGVVQGVGFRPFVYSLANRFGLGGAVWNDTTGVVIDIEGDPSRLAAFLMALAAEAPPLAHVERVIAERQPIRHYTTFAITQSEIHEAHDVLVSPDVAPCPACLRDLADPHERRYRYPFLNCTHCGPRFTIIAGVPYDRERTTMGRFAMCTACRSEYTDPGNRRFHAQPTACPACGPRLWVTDAHGDEHATDAPLVFISAHIQAGHIVAVKGLGGYHLICDALQNDVVRELRRRKRREAKPLAIMVSDLDAVQRLCEVSQGEAALLAAPSRPIVLLKRRADCPVAPEVAPGNRYLGVMLPYTPLHHLLLEQVARPLVMTSGNVTEEPMAYENGDAVRRLGGIAEYFLAHDRPIQVRCDDSVTRLVLGRALLLRRARGYAPLPIRLATPCVMPILACGGHLKNTFCLARGEYAFLSHHIGDLEDYQTYSAFIESIAHFKKLFDIVPQAVAYDLHPRYLSSQYALALEGLPHIAVQHHHAHIASCLAEHGCEGPVIGVAWDGTGYGPDGHLWGGEFLMATTAHFERLAHLEEVPLPGGEQAIRQPWRMAAVYLDHVYGEAMPHLDLDFMHRLEHRSWRVMRQMLARGINAPLTSSAGRLFDAVAALLGLRHEVQYEAQAAVELEMLAEETSGDAYPFCIRSASRPMVVETQGVIRGVVDDVRQGAPAGRIATKFHATLAEMILETCHRLRERTGLQRVVLSGGVFQNVCLLTMAISRLAARGFEVYTHSQVPPNDGGIALGQVAVANAILAQRH
jgi:hydrogenase maturation protein HypF